jgi:hypothetical protein
MPHAGPARHGSRVSATLVGLVRWYADNVYGRVEGPGTVPFYCDPARVGRFAVAPSELAAGGEAGLFRLVVALAMYQSRRDVDIMALQRGMPPRAAEAIGSARRVGHLVVASRCERVVDAETFDACCDVRRDLAARRAACAHRPRTPCHVKDATLAIGRMGDMGMLPTSAWLHLRAAGGFAGMLERATATGAPAAAAAAMVVELTRIHRIGTKLATMIVSQLATPALAPGLTPWAPRLDGNHLVVVDANVAWVIDALRPRGPQTYAARAAWFRRHARTIDLKALDARWPRTSPRLVQQAVFWFRSRSNRVAAGLGCTRGAVPCTACVPALCPFVRPTPGEEGRADR